MSEDAHRLVERSSEARRNGDRATAYDLAQRAADVARTSGELPNLGAALAALARLRRDDHQHDVAVALYEEAAELARQNGDELALAHRLRHIGDIVSEQGDLSRAEQCYGEVGTLLEAHPIGDLNRANFLRSMALLKEKQGAFDTAVQLWSEARALYAATGVEAGVRESDRRLASLRTV